MFDTLKSTLPNFSKFVALKLVGTKPLCQTKGKICAHCETEIAERAAFVIAESLTKRAKDVGDPSISNELNKQALAIMQGSWFEEFDSISNL